MRNFLVIIVSIGVSGCVILGSSLSRDFTLTCKKSFESTIERNFVYDKKTESLTEDDGTETILVEDSFFQVTFSSPLFTLDPDGTYVITGKKRVVEYFWMENVVVIYNYLLWEGERGWEKDGDPWVGICKGGEFGGTYEYFRRESGEKKS